MKTTLLVTIVLIFSSLNVLARDKPAWVEAIPQSNVRYSYFVGQGESPTLAVEALRDARSDAMLQMIRENYGITTNVEIQQIENTKEVNFFKSHLEASGDVRVEGFELVDRYEERNGDTFQAWVLFRLEIAKFERAKLAAKSGLDLAAKFDEVSGSEPTSLKVLTYPSRSEVFIDNIRYGRSPLKLKGVLDPGMHVVRMEKFGFKNVEKTVVLRADRPERVLLALEKAVGFFMFNDLPEKVLVNVDGKKLSPREFLKYKVLAGEIHKISFSGDEYEDLQINQSVASDEILEINPELKRKPAYLTAEVTHGTATVTVDGVYIGETPLKNFRIESGKRHVVIDCPDCIAEAEEIDFKPYSHKTIKLTLGKGITERAPSSSDSQSQASLREIFNKPVETTFQMAMGYKDVSFAGDPGQWLSASLGLQFICGNVGLEGNIAFNKSLKDKVYDTHSNQQTVDGSGTALWGAFNLYIDDPGLYLSVGGGSEDTSVSVTCGPNYGYVSDCVDPPQINVSQSFTSFGLGVQGRSPTNRYFLKGEMRQYSSGGGVSGQSVFAVTLGMGL